MPIRHYGVVKGRVMARHAEHRLPTPHYQVLVDAGGTPFRVAIDTRSADRHRPDLMVFFEDDYRHPMLAGLSALADGFHPLEPRPGTGALDYVRSGLVIRGDLRPLAVDVPGPDNDLNEALDAWMRRAHADPAARLYAFGARWGPEAARPDLIFGFAPGNGLHDVHMNQGNPPGRHGHDNGTWQDGALFIELPGDRRWGAVFLAFQSQSWQTDANGFPLSQPRSVRRRR